METTTHKRHAATAAVTHITNTTSSSAAITTTLPPPPHTSCLYIPLFHPFHLFCIYLQINAIEAMMLNVGDSSFAEKKAICFSCDEFICALH